MNKLYISFFLLVLALVGCSKDPSDAPAPARDQYVKSATASMTYYQNGQPAHEGSFNWSSEIYTPDGLISKREYRGEERLDEQCYCKVTEVNTYDNRVLKERTVTAMRDNSFTRYTYAYSGDRLVEMKEYVDSEFSSIYKYEYSGSSHPSRMLHYVADLTEPYLTYTYTYDVKGNVIKERSVYFNGQESTIEREYDVRGNLIRETLDAPGRDAPLVRKLVEYTYDDKGRISVREFSTYLDMNYQKWVYHYSGDGQPESIGRVESIDVFEATTEEGREYELKGVIHFDYTFGKR